MNTAFSILYVALVIVQVSGGEGTDRAQRFIDTTTQCSDALSYCSLFTQTVCSTPGNWPAQNCAKYCGLCTAGGTKRFLENSSPYWGTWSSYSACSPSCNGGIHTRTRHCYQQGKEVNTNHCYGAVSMQFHRCTQDDCSPTTPATTKCVDALSSCSIYGKTGCANSASWAVQNCAKYCGYCTDPTPAPTHGAWSHWTGFTACSVSCGSGLMYRTRACHGSTPCIGSSKDTRSCHHSCPVTTVAAPVDGHWGPWTAYSHCSHSCGSGTQTRHRYCNNPAPSNGGWTCSGYSYTSTGCHLQACVVNGGWGSWATWSSCSTSCDLGTITRHRACNHPVPSNGGTQCSGHTTDTHECSKGPCPAWSHWFEGDCSVSCGNGTVERLRHCSTGTDADCPGIAYQMVPCSNVQCV